MTADIQIEKQWNVDTYSRKLDRAIAIASGPQKSENKDTGRGLQRGFTSNRFVLIEDNEQWNTSVLPYLDNKADSLENCGFQVIKLDGYAIFLRSVAIKMIYASLEKHKGPKMSADSRRKFLKLMSEFNILPVVSAFSSYSIVNKIVKTRLRINDYLAFNTTYFEESQSDDLAFSIECDNEFILAGSGKASDLSRKFAQLINDLNDERIS